MKKAGASTPDAYSFTFANKLTNIVAGATNANHRYFYDLAGNLVTSIVNNITNIYFYNAQNKLALVRINYPDGDYVLYNFLYDSLNRRVCIGRAEARWPFLPSPYDWQMQIHDGNVPIAVSHPADAIDRLFVRGAGIAEGTGDVIAEIIGTDANNAKAVFYLTNHRGDTLQTYRGDKTLVAKYRYDAFGNQRTAFCVVNEPENAPRYTFSTKEYLPAAGLYLYQYRVYDPIAGRWTQRDPIDYQDSINLYQFCGNNAINSTDSDGRFCGQNIIIGAALGGMLGGLGGGLAQVMKNATSGQPLMQGVAKAAVEGATAGAVLGALAGAVTDPIGLITMAGLTTGESVGVTLAGTALGDAIVGTFEKAQATMRGETPSVNLKERPQTSDASTAAHPSRQKTPTTQDTTESKRDADK